MGLVLVTPPGTRPISTDELGAHLRIEGTELAEEGATLGSIIDAATDAIQEEARRQLLSATYDYQIEGFPGGRGSRQTAADALPRSDRLADVDAGFGISLPMPPLKSVASILYRDEDQVLQSMAAADYLVDTKSEPGRVIPAIGAFWPATAARPDAVTIRYAAGYGSAATSVPARLRQAVRMLAAHMWRFRGDDEQAVAVPPAVGALTRSADWGYYG